MQSYAPLTTDDLLAKVQRPRYKFEILDDASAWIDLYALGGKCYVKEGSLSVTPSGPTADPSPIAGAWSVTIRNPGGIFHPFHPTSAYKTYFRVGRKVRVSIGANYGAGAGTDYFFQRIIGYMNEPRFDHKTRTVALSGTDYSKRLADLAFREGNNRWGSSATFSTEPSGGGYGTERYAEADALDIAGEANNLTNWTDDAACTRSVTSGESSTYAMLIEKDTNVPGYVSNPNVGAVVAGDEYEVSLKCIRTAGEEGSIQALIYGAGGAPFMGYSNPSESEAWVTVTFRFTASASTDMLMKFKVIGDAGTAFKVDLVSIKEVTTPAAYTVLYELPDDANGAYAATLDGAPIYPNDPPEAFGWEDHDNKFVFVDGTVMHEGTNNLVVYYYTAQVPEEVVADILVLAGLYADQAAALAAMDYTATGITIPKVWFEPGTSGIEAIRKLCERVDYRFWLGYDGTPHFKPEPIEGAAVLELQSFGNLTNLGDYEDRKQIRNRVSIEGIEKATSAATGDKKKSRLAGSAYNQTSIDTYGEHSDKLTNDLFQDQTSLDTICAARLAKWKDPKWYADVALANCAAPLELGDTIRWWMDLETVIVLGGVDFTDTPDEYIGGVDFGETPDAYVGGAGFSATGAWVTGVIRAISLQNNKATYTVEITST